MEEIRYSRGRLWFFSIICLHVSGFMAGLFYFPQDSVRGPLALLFRGDLGRYVTLPFFGVTAFILAVRCAMVAAGSCKAITTDSQGATISTLWGSHRFAWSDLLRVRLDVSEVRRTKVYSLKFDRRAGGTISLPLGALRLPETEYRRLAQQLTDMQFAALTSSQPDDARDGIKANCEPLSTEPSRRAFGRKQV